MTTDENAWEGFVEGTWSQEIDVRDFIQRNYTPYEGDASFLAGPTEKTLRVWNTLEEKYLSEERKVRILDVDTHTPADIDAFPAGYISEDDDVIVGLQTGLPAASRHDAQRRLAHGGDRHQGGGQGGRPRGQEDLHPLPQDPQRRGLRHLHPAHPRGALEPHHHRSARRLRPRPHHRRLPPRGALRRRFLIEQKQKAKDAVADKPFSEHWARYREEHSEQIKALKKLKVMAASYGYDISGRPRTPTRRSSGPTSPTWPP